MQPTVITNPYNLLLHNFGNCFYRTISQSQNVTFYLQPIPYANNSDHLFVLQKPRTIRKVNVHYKALQGNISYIALKAI